MAYNLLKGKKGLIFGALNEQSIAWKVAERAVEEGAEIVLTNTAVSIRMGTIGRLAEKCNTIVVPADATSVEDLENLIDKTMEHFGGKFDFMLHSIGMSPNVRKGRTYDDLDYDYLSKTLDISAISFHKAIQVARKKDAINDWGSIVALSYIAAQRTLYGYNDMADAKALLESIARSFGYIYGREKHVRINTVSQSPTPTTAGSGAGDGRPDEFRREHVAAGQRFGRRLRGLRADAFLGPHAQGHDAEPLPRRRILVDGHVAPRHEDLREGHAVRGRAREPVSFRQVVSDSHGHISPCLVRPEWEILRDIPSGAYCVMSKYASR